MRTGEHLLPPGPPEAPGTHSPLGEGRAFAKTKNPIICQTKQEKVTHSQSFWGQYRTRLELLKGISPLEQGAQVGFQLWWEEG